MHQTKRSSWLLSAVLLVVFGLMLPDSARADRLWWDGSRDKENAPPGKLLSDNAGWWGESVLTGVSYRYETAPDQPADIWKDDKSKPGRRLLDGVPRGDWYVPVGQSAGKPLVVVFDFHRVCTFSEIDLVTQDAGGLPIAVTVKIEAGDSDTGPWRTVFERPAEASPPKHFYRLPLPAVVRAQAQGGFMRVTVQKPGQTTFLNEVLVWGDAASTHTLPEAIAPVSASSNRAGSSRSSVPGIAKTIFSDAQFRDWQGQLGIAGKQPAVWARLPTWDALTDRPLLPSAQQRLPRIALTQARNETECAALALTNTSRDNPITGEVVLSAFERVGAGAKEVTGVRGEVRVAGAIGSRNFGVNVGPLLAADNNLGHSLSRRYLTNAASTEDFPRVLLTPAGSALFWLSVTTEGAKPGIYRALLRYGRKVVVPVQVNVLDVTLPKPPVWVHTWSDTTSMFPFVYGDRMAREVSYKQALGVTVWNGLPLPGSAAALARTRGKTFFQTFVLPGEYRDKGYNNQITPADLTDKDEAIIAAQVHALVAQTRALGLGYDDWYAELWDEPGRPNAASFGALARFVKKADPKVRVYCNPCFWEGSGVVNDAALHAALTPWYGDLVDVSVPLSLLVRGDHPLMFPTFTAPRLVNASYDVATQSAKSEQAPEIVRYRQMAWDAFGRGANGWGFLPTMPHVAIRGTISTPRRARISRTIRWSIPARAARFPPGNLKACARDGRIIAC